MHKIFAILISCSLMLPILAIENTEAGVEQTQESSVETLSENNFNNDSLDISQQSDELKQIEEQTKFKEPTSRKKLAKKFIIAMLCVAGTSIFLYGILSIYNRIRDEIYIDPNFEENKTSLDTPNDISDAVKNFVEKTAWDQ